MVDDRPWARSVAWPCIEVDWGRFCGPGFRPGAKRHALESAIPPCDDLGIHDQVVAVLDPPLDQGPVLEQPAPPSL